MLLIAFYCYSGHTKSVIKHLKAVNPQVDITLLTNKPEDFKDSLVDRIDYYDVPPVNIKWRWLQYAVIMLRQYRFFAKFHRGRHYDIVNVHCPNVFMVYVYPFLRAMSPRLVVTPWGSDILRRDKKYLTRLAALYRKADYIATEPKNPLGNMIIRDLHIGPAKLVGNFFGSELVDYVLKNRPSVTTEEAKAVLGLSGRYVITCGYNKRECQRHKAIISAIDRVRGQLPENLSLLFPMQYGIDTRPEYVDECKTECESRNLHAVFVTRFQPAEELYLLRMATDMFVHMQTTDAYSSSVREYILCDKKIVHGSWINYDDLEAFPPLFYYPVDRLEDLGEVIVNAFHSEKIAVSQGVLDLVKSGGWERRASRMNDFFMSIV